MYTEFDWRVGILNGTPLFAAQYHMCRGHWQIIKHSSDGKSVEGHVEAILLDEVPEGVLQAACKSASLVGEGFYGVDIKVQSGQVFVIEINDNPNLDAGVEDAKQGDEVYRKILNHLLAKFESRQIRSPILEVSDTGEMISQETHDRAHSSAKQDGDDGSPSVHSLFVAAAGSRRKGVVSLFGPTSRP